MAFILDLVLEDLAFSVFVSFIYLSYLFLSQYRRKYIEVELVCLMCDIRICFVVLWVFIWF